MVKLEPLEKEDFHKLIEWNENKSSDYLLQWAGPTYNFPFTIEQIENYFNNEVNKENSNIFVYKIKHVETGKIIGTIELRETDKSKRTGRICRFLIGDENIRGQGIGTIALTEAIRIGFEDLKYEKITLGVFDFNTNAIKCYEKTGFRIENLRRNARKSPAGYWSIYDMAITKEEFLKGIFNK